MVEQRFLARVRPLSWTEPGGPTGIRPIDLYVNPALPQIEVVYAESNHGRPKADDTRRLWKLRSASRPSAVLLVVGYDAPDGIRRGRLAGLHEGNVTTTDPSLDSVATAAEGALRSGSTKQAESMLWVFFEAPADDHPVVGLRNEGLFATHELVDNVPQRPDWTDAVTESASLVGKSGEDLVRALGWTVERRGDALMLGADDRREVVAIILQGDEAFDRTTRRLGDLSPVEYAISVAHHHSRRTRRVRDHRGREGPDLRAGRARVSPVRAGTQRRRAHLRDLPSRRDYKPRLDAVLAHYDAWEGRS